MLPEPLTESAPIALRLAPDMCLKDPTTGENCAWSHGFWQYLRLLGLAGDPTNHESFFRDALARQDQTGTPLRILICGSADYAMLAMLIRAFGDRAAASTITVIDRCETPLWLNRWYADVMKLTISTARCDILDMPASEPFDLICTHSFFSYFEPKRLPALISKWHDLLRPGGVVVTANRIRAASPDSPDVFSAEQVAEFCERVRSLANAGPPLPGISAAELADHARAYASKVVAWPVHSLGDLRKLFESAGFRIEQLDSVRVSASGSESRSSAGPTAPVAAEYAHIVAARA